MLWQKYVFKSQTNVGVGTQKAAKSLSKKFYSHKMASQDG